MQTQYSFIDLLNKTAIPLRIYLDTNLRKVDPEYWWTDLVVGALPNLYTQQLNIQSETLDELDLAALLKVFDANWRVLSTVTEMDWVMRNYVKELQTIRNIWAHQKATGVTPDAQERHLSTLELFCRGIGADDVFIQEIRDQRHAILYGETDPASPSQPNIPVISSHDLSKNILSIGDQVSVKSDSAFHGVVTEVFQTGDEPRYKIFGNGKIQTYYHSQICPVSVSSEDEGFLPFDTFKALMTAEQIQNPNSSTLYSLNSAKISLIPHQFRPVLKFIKADRPRILIADGVGVGKTIEAGLILKELEARMDVSSVLIICPKPLVTERKWRDEMRNRFGESFEALDGKQLREIIKEAAYDEWPEDKKRIILPYSLLTKDNLEKSRKCCGLLQLENPPKFDLVIVDEAHHIRNTNTDAYTGVKYFIDNANAAVLLTATPIQIGDRDLFTLLNLIRPDLVPDIDTFRIMSEPNAYIANAAGCIRSAEKEWQLKAGGFLKQASGTLWGNLVFPKNPDYAKALRMLEQDSLSDSERVNLLSMVEGLHTFSSILNRTRRRDIGEYAIRKTQTVAVSMTKEQKDVYERVIAIQSEILSRVHEDTPVGFMISTLQRRAASSLFGLVPFLHAILRRNLTPWDKAECGVWDTETLDYDSLSEEVTRLIADAESLSPEKDQKYCRMVDILREKAASNPNKVMIFSSFRHTLGYLYDRLSTDGFRVGLIHGGIRDEERRYLRDNFKLPSDDPTALDILLFSEVGCEGLDYQFCDCMINYDLPWNPMKIEQRIGRIDRTGQKSESVAIFNMITPETIDAEIYNRCLTRIGVFERSLGENEEILGEISSEIQQIGENFRLSAEERAAKLNQLSENKIRQYQEEMRLEEERAGLFGLELPKMQMEQDIADATSWWMSPECLENLVRVYLGLRLGFEHEYILGSSAEKSLRLNAEFRKTLYEDFRELPFRSEYLKWKKWLKGEDKERKAYYLLSFDADNAADGELVTSFHPLVRQAVKYLLQNEPAVTAFSVRTNDVPPGKYPFAVYLWTYSGLRQERVLQPVALCKTVSDNLFSYIRIGQESSMEDADIPDSREKLEEVQYMLWKEARNSHLKQTEEMLSVRKDSLQHSYEARMGTVLDQIAAATNENIRRMKEFELQNIKLSLAERIDEIQDTAKKADISTDIVAYGVLVVQPLTEERR